MLSRRRGGGRGGQGWSVERACFPGVFGDEPNAQVKAHVARLAWLQGELDALESLTPSLAIGENAEYPWEAPDGAGGTSVKWPAADLTRRFCAPDRGAVHLRKDFVAIAAHFDELF